MNDSVQNYEETIVAFPKKEKIRNQFVGYRIEARVKSVPLGHYYGIEDESGNKILLTDQWKTIDFPKKEDVTHFYADEYFYLKYNFYTYETAVKLAKHFLSRFTENIIEVRLVAYGVKYNVKIQKYEHTGEIIKNTEKKGFQNG